MIRKHDAAPLLVAWALFVACGGGEVERAAAERPHTVATLPRPGAILLVVLDGARVDHLGVYGHAHEPMPRLADLASRAFIFEDALTASTGTNAALAALFTGLLPVEHGLGSLHEVGRERLRGSVTTLAEHLAGAGWRTLAVTALPQLAADFSGLAQGFQTYVEAPLFGERELSAQEVYFRAQRALEPILAESDPFFACVHFADARSRSRPPAAFVEPFLSMHLGPHVREKPDLAPALARAAAAPDAALDELERLLARAGGSAVYDAYQAALHDARLAAIDHHLGLLLESLHARARLADALVIVTGTRGELYERRRESTGPAFPTELVRIPLVVAGPGWPARRVAATVQSIDLVPNLLATLALPCTGFDGARTEGLWRSLDARSSVAVVWSAAQERCAAFRGPFAREQGISAKDVLYSRAPYQRLADAALDEVAREADLALGATLAQRSSPPRWIIAFAGRPAEWLDVEWRFESGFVRRAEIEPEDAEGALRRPGPTRVDGRARLAGAESRANIEGSRRSLAMRLTLKAGPVMLEEGAIQVGSRPLTHCFLPRVPSSEEVPWPQDDDGRAVEPRADFVHQGDAWWRLEVRGESGAQVRVLLARFPPSRPGEVLSAVPAIGRVRVVDGRADALWLSGLAPFEVHLEKQPSEGLALAVEVEGVMLPASSIRWRGRCFSPPGEWTLYLPDWMGDASAPLDEPGVESTVLVPGTVRVWRETGAPPQGDHVASSPEQLEFVRWLGADE